MKSREGPVYSPRIAQGLRAVFLGQSQQLRRFELLIFETAKLVLRTESGLRRVREYGEKGNDVKRPHEPKSCARKA